MDEIQSITRSVNPMLEIELSRARHEHSSGRSPPQASMCLFVHYILNKRGSKVIGVW